MVAPHKNRLEKQQLLAIISKHESIIDSRKADRKTIVAKRKAWTQIATEFNRLPNIRPCNSNQLKRFWSNLKARDLQIKKEKSPPKGRNSRGEGSKLSQQFYMEEDYEHLDEEQQECTDSEDDSTPIGKRKQEPELSATICDSDNSKGDSNTNLLSPNVNSVINAQLAKLEMSMSHMREIHGLAIQREKLQIRVLEQQLNEQTKLHQFRLDNEREMHQLRLKHEQELHLQRMRYEQEQIVLQQGKIHEVHGYTIR